MFIPWHLGSVKIVKKISDKKILYLLSKIHSKIFQFGFSLVGFEFRVRKMKFEIELRLNNPRFSHQCIPFRRLILNAVFGLDKPG